MIVWMGAEDASPDGLADDALAGGPCDAACCSPGASVGRSVDGTCK